MAVVFTDGRTGKGRSGTIRVASAHRGVQLKCGKRGEDATAGKRRIHKRFSLGTGGEGGGGGFR